MLSRGWLVYRDIRTPRALIVRVVHFGWIASDEEMQHRVSFSAEVCVSRWACLLGARRV